MSIIEIEHLTKQYRDVTAVDDLNLSIEQGDVFGFIGPNGAGKTTTIKTVATLIRPTLGKVTVGGMDVTAEPLDVRRIIGYMPDFFGVYDDVKVWEYLDFFAAAYKIDRRRRPQIIDDVLSLTDLMDKREAYLENLSRGMKQRLCLAKTLIHDPQVLLLDEPASGLDPRARIEIRALLKELQTMGKTIFVSSHILHELSDLCNKIGIIENGKLIIAGEVHEIMEQTTGGTRVELEVVGDLQQAVEVLQSIPQTTGVGLVDDHIEFIFTGDPDRMAELLSALMTQGVRVKSFAEKETNLEDVFIQTTKGIVS